MCGLTGFFPADQLAASRQEHLHFANKSLELISHRGPDHSQSWHSDNGKAILAHARLSIIDIDSGNQPFHDPTGRFVIVFNGELYNYRQLRESYSLTCRTKSDTEVALACYIKLGPSCLRHFRGMFSFLIWDNQKNLGFVARDRFGIKPLYYAQTSKGLAFSSEIKGLLPFLDACRVSPQGLSDYFNFQFTLSGRTLFQDVCEFPAAHYAFIDSSNLRDVAQYWCINYDIDYVHTELWFCNRLHELLEESVQLHCISDVPIGSYVSGGVDSTLISSLSAHLRQTNQPQGFVGRYLSHEGFDESGFAKLACDQQNINCNITTITPDDFVDNFETLVWHLDQPVAGPGAFGQYIVSRDAAKHVKVILGGQGGDEIFGGYTRYLIGYFEQCIKGAIDGTLADGNYVVTYESIIPSLRNLQNYKPLLKEFWASGLFDSLDQRYWRLINRANSFGGIISPSLLSSEHAHASFQQIFYMDGTEQASYLDRMSHFDFRTLLPALLHVEDRVSMAHGLESRVPFLDHILVDFAATIPADIKFKNGQLKRLLPLTFKDRLPPAILERKDKMGFPIPLNNWIRDHAGVREYVGDTLGSVSAGNRPYLAKPIPLDDLLSAQGPYGRAVWALLSLEVWHKLYID